MSLTVRETVNSALAYLDSEQRNIPPSATADNPLPSILDAIHGAMQELVCLGPPFQLKAPRSYLVKPPAAITVPTLTAGATTFSLTILQGWLDYFLGCSVLFTGETTYNQIIGRASTTVTLLNPIRTGGTNVTGTVYCDSIILDTDVIQVLRPVTIVGRTQLQPLARLDDVLFALHGTTWDSPDNSDAIVSRNTTGNPAFYFVDQFYSSVLSEPVKRLRLAPMPSRLTSDDLTIQAILSAPTFDTDDIYGAGPGYADPGVAIPVPDPFAISVFLPVMLQRLTGSPYWRNKEAAVEINRQYTAARAIITKMFPQAADGLPPLAAATPTSARARK